MPNLLAGVLVGRLELDRAEPILCVVCDPHYQQFSRVCRTQLNFLTPSKATQKGILYLRVNLNKE